MRRAAAWDPACASAPPRLRRPPRAVTTRPGGSLMNGCATSATRIEVWAVTCASAPPLPHPRRRCAATKRPGGFVFMMVKTAISISQRSGRCPVLRKPACRWEAYRECMLCSLHLDSAQLAPMRPPQTPLNAAWRCVLCVRTATTSKQRLAGDSIEPQLHFWFSLSSTQHAFGCSRRESGSNGARRDARDAPRDGVQERERSDRDRSHREGRHCTDRWARLC